jgi:uncharacterized repeat protein (TIGR03803 family)
MLTRISLSPRRLFALAAALLMFIAVGYAQGLNTIHTFSGNPDGQPAAALTIDAAGNLFGASLANSAANDMIFELSPSSGSWNLSRLYTFEGNADGQSPSTNLVMDAAGNFYGATYVGGHGFSCFQGCGTVFKLSPDGSGGWTKTTIYNFGAFPTDGNSPTGNLALDATGNLYGTTQFGGVYGSGTAYVLRPLANGTWKETILHHFGSTTASGGNPQGGVVLDAKGNVYGTLASGGVVNPACPSGCGAVFELSVVSGKWQQTLRHVFSGSDGRAPTGGVAFDKAGNIYGTTQLGGKNSAGVVFGLTPKSGGGWKVHVLHVFDGKSGGLQPFAGVTFDGNGNLYGSTAFGGNFASACTGAPGCGLVYEMTPSTGGWSFKVLHAFDGADGYMLENPLTLGSTGTLFGTTELGGGSANSGTVFEITP